MGAMILLASLIHVFWAITLWSFPESANATAVHSFVSILGAPLTSITLIFVATSAMTGLNQSRHHPHTMAPVYLMLPQQLFLFMSAGAALNAVGMAQYADGTIVPRAHIFVDQFPYMVAALLHTGAIGWHFVPLAFR